MAPLSEAPEFTSELAHYEFAERTRAITHGGIGAMHNLVIDLELRDLIDEWLVLLIIPRITFAREPCRSASCKRRRSWRALAPCLIAFAMDNRIIVINVNAGAVYVEHLFTTGHAPNGAFPYFDSRH